MYVLYFTDCSNEYTQNEIWDSFSNNSDNTAEEQDDETPELPISQNKQTEETIKAKAILQWIVGFLLNLQAKYYISNAAMNLLIFLHFIKNNGPIFYFCQYHCKWIFHIIPCNVQKH